MNRVWHAEAIRVSFFVSAGAIVGLWLGHASWGVIAGLSLYAAYVVLQVIRIERWVRDGAKLSRAPESFGIWDRVIQHVYDLKQRTRQRKKRLRDLLSRFHRFTEAIPDATVLLKRNGEIEWSNTAARVLLGIRNPQDRGHRIDQLVRDPNFQTYYSAADFSEPLEISSPVETDVELSLRVVEYGRNERLLTARDISAQRRVQEARRDFVANVSHELRTPLTVVSGYLETIIESPEAPENFRDQLVAMQQQSERMQSLVDDLLALSRLEMDSAPEQEFESVAVASLVRSICADAARLSESHHFDCDVDSELRLFGQSSALRSAFSNLVVNAVRHTPPGTRVSVVWKRIATGAVFTVSDDGPGIERAHLGRLTERFYRVDRSRSRASGGTGLGLAIVKHVVERHQGYVEIDSTPGQGARFSCHFPIQRVDGAKAVPLAAVINP